MKLYGIVGAGGFGREVMPVAKSMLQSRYPESPFDTVFVVEGEGGGEVNGVKVMSAKDFIAMPFEKYFNIAIADSAARERIASEFCAEGAEPFSVVAPNSLDLAANSIGVGAIMCPFSMVTANARVGRFFHANIYSYVAHDCIVGDFVTFAPGVHCNGRVVIEDHAYIGTGAIIKQGTDDRPIVIGRGAVVGMGAVVTKSVAPNSTVIGNPASLFSR